jgi:hypothetical protein
MPLFHIGGIRDHLRDAGAGGSIAVMENFSTGGVLALSVRRTQVTSMFLLA